jgi:hypothetical protein
LLIRIWRETFEVGWEYKMNGGKRILRRALELKFKGKRPVGNRRQK